MSIKRKLVLGATLTVCSLALTVPMSFAACPVSEDCGCNKNSEIVTPDTATCSKCKKSDCDCAKKKKKCDPCETQKKDDCGCATGAAAPCLETKPLNQQSYAYPNAIYSNTNTSQVGENKNNATIHESLLTPQYKGVPVECGCPTGAAAPVINSTDMPTYDCADAPKVSSATHMDIIKITKEPFDSFA